MKDQVISNTSKRIKHIQFGVLSPQEIAKVAEIEICQRDLYNIGTRDPVLHGCVDRRLGISDKTSTCETCGEKLAECPGHYGYIKLNLPVFHIGYFKAVLAILRTICKCCSRVLLEESERRKYLRRFRAPKLENYHRTKIVKAVTDQCRKVSVCPYCLANNGNVKKVGAFRLIHEKYKARKVTPLIEEFRQTFTTAMEYLPDLKQHLAKAQEDMNPMKVWELFRAISDEDCELLGLNPTFGRPELYIWTYVPVPPVCIRPSVAQEGKTNEDDLTVKLTEIIFTNVLIKEAMEKGASTQHLMEQWEFLQLSTAIYINSELPGVASANPGRPIRSFCQRLKGKQGRFRGNLSGKRVDFSGRTVISPDPNLRIDQIAVPDRVAKILTYPDRVNAHNIEKLRNAIKNGPDVHPGANHVVMGSNGIKKFLKFADRTKVAEDLRIGDIVERHLIDGDIVLFNRQPSLHKLSILSHFVVVKPWRTFRFNECVCNPYNADFDGDEMNLHVPQTEEARIEAMELMGTKNNLVTPRNGEPIIAAIQDFITASFLITQKNLFLDRSQVGQLTSFFGDALIKIDLPPPVIWKPVRLWTGKQVFGLLLRPNSKCNILVNLETKNRSLTPAIKRKDLCPNDGWLVIQNSVIMCGAIDKSIVGDGNKNSVFYVLLRDFGPLAAAESMNRLAKLCARWLGNRGFSIGINDVQPGQSLRQKKEQYVEKGYGDCDELIAKSKAGQLENQPGCDQEQTLESKISGVLSKIRDDVGKICMQELSKYNAPLIMSRCGSKGSVINVCQMVSCVGQQIISGSRIPNGFVDRSLPHFLPNSKIPAAKGFVSNSFYTGLTPTEFFFHAVSGREGLVDTAVKTAETGYMSRRLMKALEDLTTHYDLSVRNSVGGMVQFCYGDDALDPTNIEGDNKPVEFNRNLLHCMHSVSPKNEEPLLPFQVVEIMEMEFNSPRFVNTKKLSKAFEDYVNSIRQFIQSKVVDKLAAIRTCHGFEAYLQKSVTKTKNQDFAKTKAVNNLFMITKSQILKFLDICFVKYMKAKIEPGTAVGAVGAQSIGEPGTQMTLKTFHFAGVASMSITLGVPRIKEIINAAKVISTPIIEAKLVTPNVTSARIVKGRVEKTILGDIAEYIEEVYTPGENYLKLKIDIDAIRKLQLEIDLYSIADCIAYAPKLKIGAGNVHVQQPDSIRVYITSKESGDLYYNLQLIKRSLPNVIVEGIPTINRAVISEEKNEVKLLVEGYGLQNVMITEGIIENETTSNNIIEVQETLGIEAARQTIIREINYTMGQHGMTIDPRHVKLLGDTMTYKGEVLGITRYGIAKMKDSVLMLASFEKTADHVFDAALYSKRDSIEGVSECIIMGIPMSIGTGLFKLLYGGGGDATDAVVPASGRKLLFDCSEYHVNLYSS